MRIRLTWWAKMAKCGPSVLVALALIKVDDKANCVTSDRQPPTLSA